MAWAPTPAEGLRLAHERFRFAGLAGCCATRWRSW
jgi:hypothetical protein